MTGTAGPPKTTSPMDTRRRSGDEVIGFEKIGEHRFLQLLVRTGPARSEVRVGLSATRISAQVYLLSSTRAGPGADVAYSK